MSAFVFNLNLSVELSKHVLFELALSVSIEASPLLLGFFVPLNGCFLVFQYEWDNVSFSVHYPHPNLWFQNVVYLAHVPKQGYELVELVLV